MKEELKELAVNIILSTTGVYGKINFGGKKYTRGQIVSMILFCSAISYVMQFTGLKQWYQNAICIIVGLAADSFMKYASNVVGKALKKSEDKAADKLSDKIDKLT